MMTDADRLLALLRAAGSRGIHSHDIRRHGVSGNPSQRAADLRNKGYEIEATRENRGKRPGCRYRLLIGSSAEQKPASSEVAPRVRREASHGVASGENAPTLRVDSSAGSTGGRAEPGTLSPWAGNAASGAPESCETCGGTGVLHTGECRSAMSGPTCFIASCPPCQAPETEPCPDCVSDELFPSTPYEQLRDV